MDQEAVASYGYNTQATLKCYMCTCMKTIKRRKHCSAPEFFNLHLIFKHYKFTYLSIVFKCYKPI